MNRNEYEATRAGATPARPEPGLITGPVCGCSGESALQSSLPRLRRAEASAYLGSRYGLRIAVATLAKLATTGGGPAYNKAGRTPLYPPQELDRWAMARLGGLRRSTSEPGA